MTVLIIKTAASILIGFLAGPAAVYVFNHMPAGWLCEYGEDPSDDPRLTAGEKRIKENPWRWVYAVGFIGLCLRLSLFEYEEGGLLSVQSGVTAMTTQLAAAGLIACWILLIIAHVYSFLFMRLRLKNRHTKLPLYFIILLDICQIMLLLFYFLVKYVIINIWNL